MTLDEFLDELRTLTAAGVRWRVRANDKYLRTTSLNCDCPIEAVARARGFVGAFYDLGALLGLSDSDMSYIIVAADNRAADNRAAENVRARLLDACGLSGASR